MLMGDFNADCSYVTSSEWSSIRLWSDDRFVWLVDNDLDTTTTTTHCAYDRLDNTGHIAHIYKILQSTGSCGYYSAQEHVVTCTV